MCFNNHRNIKHLSIFGHFQSSRGEFKSHLGWAGCTWTKQAESHRQPHPGEMFWPVLPFPNFQPGFCKARFLPLPRQPHPASSSEDYHKHTLVSIYCCEDTSSCIPCGHVASSKYKYTMRTLTDRDPYKKVKLLKKKKQPKNKQFCS